MFAHITMTEVPVMLGIVILSIFAITVAIIRANRKS